MVNMATIRQSIAEIQMRWFIGPFESGENDEVGENGKSSPKPSEKVK